jgi:hypothetical protein
MKARIAALTTLLVAAGAMAQRDSGPFSPREAELLDAVWPQIREAGDYDDIDWRALGLAGPPGDLEARELMAENWDALRRAGDFDDIDWRATVRDRSSSRYSNERYRDRERRGAQVDEYGEYAGPFTSREAALMREVWPQIREAAAFEDIDWRAVGLSGPPGGREARRVMAANWGALRTAADFDHIDWDGAMRYRTR